MGESGFDDGALTSMPAVRAAAERLAAAALVRIQERPSGRARVEDYIAVLGSITGEAALVAAGVFDIETSGLAPGSPVFGPQINEILTGDTDTLGELPPTSVVAVLVRELVPGVVPIEMFDRLGDVYRHVAASVGSAAWGRVATTAGEDHRPTILPIQVAFELRGAVDAAQAAAGLPRNLRHIPCALAPALGLRQVASSIEMRLAVTLALEVTFGVAKMIPMSKAAFNDVAAKAKPN
jgi:hypothetical protein